MTRARTGLAAVVVALGLLAGCAQLPTSGPVRHEDVSASAGSPQAPYFNPPGPATDASPASIVASMHASSVSESSRPPRWPLASARATFWRVMLRPGASGLPPWSSSTPPWPPWVRIATCEAVGRPARSVQAR